MFGSADSQRKNRTLDEYYVEAHKRLTPGCISYLIIFFALGLANMGDASEIFSIKFLLSDKTFRDEILKGNDGVVVAAHYMGMMVGGIVAGPISDVYRGRRSTLMFGLFMCSAFGIASSTSTNYWQMSFCRMMVGLGVGTVGACLPVLTTEHAPSTHRGRYNAIVTTSSTIGGLYAASMAMWLFGRLETSWNVYVLVYSAPGVISLILVWLFVPESARHLALQGQFHEAAAVANYMGEAMGYDDGDSLYFEEVDHEFKDKKRQDRSVGEVRRIIAELYRGTKRRRMILLQTIWVAFVFSAGINTWLIRLYQILDLPHPYIMGIIYAAASLPAHLISIMIMDRYKRTHLLAACAAVLSVTMSGFAVAYDYIDEPIVFISMACSLHFIASLCFSILLVVTSESFGTASRSSALGICAATGRAGAIVVNLLNGTILTSGSSPIIMFLVAASVALFGAILIRVSSLQDMTGIPLGDSNPTVPQPNVQEEHPPERQRQTRSQLLTLPSIESASREDDSSSSGGYH